MKNKSLAKDYIKRAENRISALEALYKVQSWADVVRESQEVVELALKALLRTSGIEVPRVHDVSTIMLDEKNLIPIDLHPHLDRLSEVSRGLRRDRELAYYGSEDLTPSEFYQISDADKAMEESKWVVATVKPFIK